MQIPRKADGSLYELHEAMGAQRIILYHVFSTLRNWLTKSPDYKPFHRIISGGGGSGKSYLVHQITSTIRKMFSKNETVQTTAYTGSAAYNIRGKTIHSAYAINCVKIDQEMSQTNRDKLIKGLRHTVALLFDERSMIPADVLGACERNVALTAFGGSRYKHKWGGIPIILFLGDDYQLPPVQIMGKGKGAFHALDYKTSVSKQAITVELRGMEEFLRLSKGVMMLDQNQRIQQNQEDFKDILERVRVGNPTEEDKMTLLSLHVLKLPSKIREKYENDTDTLHIFATKEMCSEHNFKKLKEFHNADNPVAFLKHNLPRHLYENTNDINAIPQITCFSRGCKVSIKGRNFSPLLGLYNGAIGTVHEIVYREGESPNTNNLPLYVAVDFPGYLGRLHEYGCHIWDKTNPTIIPVPTVKTIDEKTKKQ